MRLRLLLRRFTITAPRMSVRSGWSWPFRCVLSAIVLGFCAAIGLWAFEFGKGIAGLDKGNNEEFKHALIQIREMRAEMLTLTVARDKAQSVANTIETLQTTEKVAQDGLATQIKKLETENQSLRDDLGFFEKLIPTTGVAGVAIRSLQAEVRNGHEINWQVLVIQSQKNPPEFNGRLELSFTGVLNGRAWTAALPSGAQAFKLTQYGRIEGVYVIPTQVVVKGVTAKILDGSLMKAVQSITL